MLALAVGAAEGQLRELGQGFGAGDQRLGRADDCHAVRAERPAVPVDQACVAARGERLGLGTRGLREHAIHLADGARERGAHGHVVLEAAHRCTSTRWVV